MRGATGNHHNLESVQKPSTPRRLDGYPRLAEFIARDGDAAIFRKFGHLSARNLLYLQSELLDLEGKLQALDERDASCLGDENAQKAAREWRYYSDEANKLAKLHQELQFSIRKKLKEYHEALLLEQQVLALPPPAPRTTKAFREWFDFVPPMLWGRDASLFDDEQDLVALAPVETDRLNIILENYFGWLFKQKDSENCKERRSEGLFYYPRHRIQAASAVISVFASAFLLIGGVVSLLSTSDARTAPRIGLIVVFTSIFAAVVGLLTNARRSEIFGATAAYAAVLVVFVSNNLSKPSNGP